MYRRSTLKKFGHNNYRHYVAPAAVGTKVITRSPSLRSAPRNSFHISNRELCFPVIAQPASTQYSVVSFPIQPGLSSVFPLLSSTARTFVRYKIKYAIEFVPNVGTSAPGTIFIASDTNINESPPGSPSQLMSYAGAVSANIWSQTSFPSNRRMMNTNDKKMFIRYGSLTGDQDIKLYDTAQIHVALAGIDPTLVSLVVGQLYVNYKCTFFEQRLETVIDSNIFTTYPSQSDVTENLPADGQNNLQYVYGTGDVQYSGQFAYQDSSIAPEPGVTLVFPTIGYYLLLQNMEFEEGGTPLANSRVAPQPFGGVIPSIMGGYFGASVIVSPPIDIQAVFTSAITTQSCQCLQVVQVLEAGTYISGTQSVIGNGWVSKEIGISAYAGGTAVSNTNEVEIYAYENSAGPSTVVLKNVTIETTMIDAAVAAYFFPGTFVASPGPLTAMRTLHQHSKQAPIRGLHHLSQATRPRRVISSSKIEPEEDYEPEQPSKGPSLEELQKFYNKYN